MTDLESMRKTLKDIKCKFSEGEGTYSNGDYFRYIEISEISMLSYGICTICFDKHGKFEGFENGE